MTDLPQPAVEHLYPVLLLFIALVSLLGVIIGGLWAGFRWLQGQITRTAQTMLEPVITRVAMVEKSAEAAHRRMDEWLGKRT